MALSVGTRLGPYEVVALIGAGGMSACGYAEGISVSSRWGWGPSASGKMLTASPSRSGRIENTEKLEVRKQKLEGRSQNWSRRFRSAPATVRLKPDATQ